MISCFLLDCVRDWDLGLIGNVDFGEFIALLVQCMYSKLQTVFDILSQMQLEFGFFLSCIAYANATDIDLVQQNWGNRCDICGNAIDFSALRRAYETDNLLQLGTKESCPF